MNILQIINTLEIGGAERLISDFTPLMIQDGHKVDVLLLKDNNKPFKNELLQKGVRINALSKKGTVYNPLLIFKLIKHLKRYDVVHVHLFPAQYWVAIAKKLSGAKCKLITTEHSTHNRRRDIALFRFFDKKIYSLYDKIIAISTETASNLANYLSKSDKIKVIENGISIASFSNAVASKKEDLIDNYADKSILVAMLARFSEQKDQATLIKSFSHLPEKYTLLLIGDGVTKEKSINLTNELGLAERVHFLGTRTDVASILKAIDIYVMSSHWEGFGLAAAEAMAAEKPVIASDVPGLRELVENAGILFEQGNNKELANAIKKLGEDLTYRTEIAHKCFLKSQNYNIETMTKKYLSLYKN